MSDVDTLNEMQLARYLEANIDGFQCEVMAIGGDGRTCMKSEIIYSEKR